MVRQIWIGDLASYNNDNLRGGWLETDCKTGLDLFEEAKELGYIRGTKDDNGETYTAHEYMIFDSEGFGDLVREYTSLDQVSFLSEVLSEIEDEYGVHITELAIKFAERIRLIDPLQLPGAFEQSFAGIYTSLGIFAEEISEGRYNIPKGLENYIDWDAMGCDMELDGDVFTIPHKGDLAVFWSHY